MSITPGFSRAAEVRSLSANCLLTWAEQSD